MYISCISLDIVIYSGMLWKPNWKVFILCIKHFYLLLECVIQIDDMNVVMYCYEPVGFEIWTKESGYNEFIMCIKCWYILLNVNSDGLLFGNSDVLLIMLNLPTVLWIGDFAKYSLIMCLWIIIEVYYLADWCFNIYMPLFLLYNIPYQLSVK